MLQVADKTAANPILIRQIKGMLAYWREETEELDHDTAVLLDAERENLLRAIEAGLLFTECGVETAKILYQAFPFVERRAYWPEWIPLLKRSLENNPNLPTEIRVLLMARLGQAYQLERNMERAIAIHLEAEALAQTTGETRLIGRAQHDLLEDYLFSKEYEKAITVGKTAIELLVSNGTGRKLLANCYKMVGSSYLGAGDAETGNKYLNTAVNHWRTLDDPLFLARVLSDYATSWLHLGKLEKSIVHYKEAAVILEPTFYELDKCLIQMNLGSTYAAQKNWPKAEAAFHQANSQYLRQSANIHRKARVNNNLGYVLFHQGKYEMAEEYLRISAELWEQIHDDLETANTLSTLADSLVARNQVEAARPIYDQVIETFRKYPDNPRAIKLLKEYEIVREQVNRKKKSQPA